ncbi:MULTISPECIES: hypothetical protein [Methylobacterium]|jgi:hypothetical protein|uniref:hypothetical protein n=1 Tax=Methylobacterium TaxID=407 RepID=UPI000A721738|nr:MULTISPECIES: hypothetical protein [Methylobacterium]UHC20241.1 hypothetical protein LRS73_34800 [Methylobacterium currus]
MSNLLDHDPPAAPAGEPTYRAFFLGPSGAVQRADILRVLTDDEAREAVRCLVNSYGIEVWERSRMIERFPPRAVPYLEG